MHIPGNWKWGVLAGLAVALASPVLAQHGGRPGMGPGMGHMGMEPGHSTPRFGHKQFNPDTMMRAHGKTAAQILAHNNQLSSRLASLLPAGMNVQTAAAGFRNLGQFIAAVHVSHNLGIPFLALKDKMLGPPSMSLGKAIHTLRPAANAKSALRKADGEARRDLRDSTRKKESMLALSWIL